MNCSASITDYAKVALKIICTVGIDKGHTEYLFKDIILKRLKISRSFNSIIILFTNVSHTPSRFHDAKLNIL